MHILKINTFSKESEAQTRVYLNKLRAEGYVVRLGGFQWEYKLSVLEEVIITVYKYICVRVSCTHVCIAEAIMYLREMNNVQ